MKQQKHLFGLLFIVACMLGLTACNNDVLELVDNSTINGIDGRHTIPLVFVGNVVGFDESAKAGNVQSRASDSSWNDGDKIFLNFFNGSAIISGDATYSKAYGWSVSYDGNLAIGSNQKCEARYFVNADFSNPTLVGLSSNSEIYEDVNASYSYNDGELTVTASLVPKTGRIRFTGTADSKIHTTGISIYTSFTPITNTFSTIDSMITSVVASDGSTPYIYGTFTDSDKTLGICGSEFAYSRICSSDVLKVGESGYMSIPSEGSHNNWRNGLYLKVKGVEFKMVPVAGYSEGFYLIGETEVTEELYRAVNGESSSSQKPVRNVSYDDVTSVIKKLNKITNLNFSLPTQEQWVFAAKGGIYSHNYTYSGSNTLEDVGWYSLMLGNVHDVKKKAPNELGIYDMSGNVSEMTSTMYEDGKIVTLGGSNFIRKKIVPLESSSVSTTDVNLEVGFRLILTCP